VAGRRTARAHVAPGGGASLPACATPVPRARALGGALSTRGGGAGEEGGEGHRGGVRRCTRAAAASLSLLLLLGQVHVGGGQGRLPTLPSTSALLPPGATAMSEFVPSSDQRLSKAPSKHRAGDGFFPAASSTFKLFDETLNAQGGRGQDWGQDGKELAVTVAQDSVRLGPFQALHRFGTMAPRTASAFQDCDGVLGLAYSPAPDSASLLKSLFFPRRPSWNISGLPLYQ